MLALATVTLFSRPKRARAQEPKREAAQGARPRRFVSRRASRDWVSRLVGAEAREKAFRGGGSGRGHLGAQPRQQHRHDRLLGSTKQSAHARKILLRPPLPSSSKLSPNFTKLSTQINKPFHKTASARSSYLRCWVSARIGDAL